MLFELENLILWQQIYYLCPFCDIKIIDLIWSQAYIGVYPAYCIIIIIIIIITVGSIDLES